MCEGVRRLHSLHTTLEDAQRERGWLAAKIQDRLQGRQLRLVQVWCGVVWCGVVWCDVDWYDVDWWLDMELCGVACLGGVGWGGVW